uniref:Uncharacterized protein n=1 Tax=Chromera velia CCMP2878 TaxID=1169474 RepID=A0A0G4GV01_9ALVE|eukprot:Cvel_5256.t1-p1 / transcript=Cvel_5256.t1 / gene=Cvel_5256 / organism=Chromera_velia_CCMP2878 / gene_product=hypothetical protein / transcript_product=hypothetical protein / location=Cvel_scaffold242:83408-106931(-) / protein_length=2541 / sequence_SO=supercontig / SO=protein_coding / is_pseudo=false
MVLGVLLQSFLWKYVKGVTGKLFLEEDFDRKFRANFLGTQYVAKDVLLDPVVLTEYVHSIVGLPIRIKAGYVGTIDVEAVGTESGFLLTLKDLVLVAGPDPRTGSHYSTNKQWKSELITQHVQVLLSLLRHQRINAIKKVRQALAAATQKMMKTLYRAKGFIGLPVQEVMRIIKDTRKGVGGLKLEGDQILTGETDILRYYPNLKIRAQNVGIRFEDDMTDPGHPYGFCIHMASVELGSTEEVLSHPVPANENAQEQREGETEEGFHQNLEITGLSVSFDQNPAWVPSPLYEQCTARHMGVFAEEKILPRELLTKIAYAASASTGYFLQPTRAKVQLNVDVFPTTAGDFREADDPAVAKKIKEFEKKILEPREGQNAGTTSIPSNEDLAKQVRGEHTKVTNLSGWADMVRYGLIGRPQKLEPREVFGQPSSLVSDLADQEELLKQVHLETEVLDDTYPDKDSDAEPEGDEDPEVASEEYPGMSSRAKRKKKREQQRALAGKDEENVAKKRVVVHLEDLVFEIDQKLVRGLTNFVHAMRHFHRVETLRADRPPMYLSDLRRGKIWNPNDFIANTYVVALNSSLARQLAASQATSASVVAQQQQLPGQQQQQQQRRNKDKGASKNLPLFKHVPWNDERIPYHCIPQSTLFPSSKTVADMKFGQRKVWEGMLTSEIPPLPSCEKYGGILSKGEGTAAQVRYRSDGKDAGMFIFDVEEEKAKLEREKKMWGQWGGGARPSQTSSQNSTVPSRRASDVNHAYTGGEPNAPHLQQGGERGGKRAWPLYGIGAAEEECEEEMLGGDERHLKRSLIRQWWRYAAQLVLASNSPSAQGGRLRREVQRRIDQKRYTRIWRRVMATTSPLKDRGEKLHSMEDEMHRQLLEQEYDFPTVSVWRILATAERSYLKHKYDMEVAPLNSERHKQEKKRRERDREEAETEEQIAHKKKVLDHYDEVIQKLENAFRAVGSIISEDLSFGERTSVHLQVYDALKNQITLPFPECDVMLQFQRENATQMQTELRQSIHNCMHAFDLHVYKLSVSDFLPNRDVIPVNTVAAPLGLGPNYDMALSHLLLERLEGDDTIRRRNKKRYEEERKGRKTGGLTQAGGRTGRRGSEGNGPGNAEASMLAGERPKQIWEDGEGRRLSEMPSRITSALAPTLKRLSEERSTALPRILQNLWIGTAIKKVEINLCRAERGAETQSFRAVVEDLIMGSCSDPKMLRLHASCKEADVMDLRVDDNGDKFLLPGDDREKAGCRFLSLSVHGTQRHRVQQKKKVRRAEAMHRMKQSQQQPQQENEPQIPEEAQNRGSQAAGTAAIPHETRAPVQREGMLAGVQRFLGIAAEQPQQPAPAEGPPDPGSTTNRAAGSRVRFQEDGEGQAGGAEARRGSEGNTGGATNRRASEPDAVAGRPGPGRGSVAMRASHTLGPQQLEQQALEEPEGGPGPRPALGREGGDLNVSTMTVPAEGEGAQEPAPTARPTPAQRGIFRNNFIRRVSNMFFASATRGSTGSQEGAGGDGGNPEGARPRGLRASIAGGGDRRRSSMGADEVWNTSQDVDEEEQNRAAAAAAAGALGQPRGNRLVSQGEVTGVAARAAMDQSGVSGSRIDNDHKRRHGSPVTRQMREQRKQLEETEGTGEEKDSGGMGPLANFGNADSVDRVKVYYEILSRHGNPYRDIFDFFPTSQNASFVFAQCETSVDNSLRLPMNTSVLASFAPLHIDYAAAWASGLRKEVLRLMEAHKLQSIQNLKCLGVSHSIETAEHRVRRFLPMGSTHMKKVEAEYNLWMGHELKRRLMAKWGLAALTEANRKESLEKFWKNMSFEEVCACLDPQDIEMCRNHNLRQWQIEKEFDETYLSEVQTRWLDRCLDAERERDLKKDRSHEAELQVSMRNYEAVQRQLEEDRRAREIYLALVTRQRLKLEEVDNAIKASNVFFVLTTPRTWIRYSPEQESNLPKFDAVPVRLEIPKMSMNMLMLVRDTVDDATSKKIRDEQANRLTSEVVSYLRAYYSVGAKIPEDELLKDSAWQQRIQVEAGRYVSRALKPVHAMKPAVRQLGAAKGEYLGRVQDYVGELNDAADKPKKFAQLGKKKKYRNKSYEEILEAVFVERHRTDTDVEQLLKTATKAVGSWREAEKMNRLASFGALPQVTRQRRWEPRLLVEGTFGKLFLPPSISTAQLLSQWFFESVEQEVARVKQRLEIFVPSEERHWTFYQRFPYVRVPKPSEDLRETPSGLCFHEVHLGEEPPGREAVLGTTGVDREDENENKKRQTLMRMAANMKGGTLAWEPYEGGKRAIVYVKHKGQWQVIDFENSGVPVRYDVAEAAHTFKPELQTMAPVQSEFLQARGRAIRHNREEVQRQRLIEQLHPAAAHAHAVPMPASHPLGGHANFPQYPQMPSMQEAAFPYATASAAFPAPAAASVPGQLYQEGRRMSTFTYDAAQTFQVPFGWNPAAAPSAQYAYATEGTTGWAPNRQSQAGYPMGQTDFQGVYANGVVPGAGQQVYADGGGYVWGGGQDAATAGAGVWDVPPQAYTYQGTQGIGAQGANYYSMN